MTCNYSVHTSPETLVIGETGIEEVASAMPLGRNLPGEDPCRRIPAGVSFSRLRMASCPMSSGKRTCPAGTQTNQPPVDSQGLAGDACQTLSGADVLVEILGDPEVQVARRQPITALEKQIRTAIPQAKHIDIEVAHPDVIPTDDDELLA